MNVSVAGEANWRKRLISLGASGALAAMSTGLMSAAGFGMAVVFARTLDATEFGQYGIGIALVMVIGGLLNDLFGIAFVLDLEGVAQESRRQFISTSVFCLVLGALGLGAIVLGGARLAGFASGGAHVQLSAAAIVFGGTAFAAQEMLCRAAYSERKVSAALGRSIAFVVTVAILIGGAHLSDVRLDVQGALWVYGVAMAVSGVYVWLALKLGPLQWDPGSARTVLRALSSIGLSQVFVGLSNLARTQSVIVVTGVVFGAVAAGEIAAGRLLVAPAMMAIPPLTYLAMPRMTVLALREGGGLLVARLTVLLIALVSTFVIVYASAALLYFDEVVSLLLGGRYADILPITAAWAAVLLAVSLRSVCAMALQVARERRLLVNVSILALFAYLGLAAVALSLPSHEGVVYALAASEMVLVLGILTWVTRMLRAPRRVEE